MSETTTEQVSAPEWTIGWRLQRSLDHGGVSVQQMAEELGVSRSTISKWCHDIGSPPRTIYLRHWAHRCKVPFDWLIYGRESGPARGGDGAYGVEGLPFAMIDNLNGEYIRLPRKDSNLQPAGRAHEPRTFGHITMVPQPSKHEHLSKRLRAAVPFSLDLHHQMTSGEQLPAKGTRP